MAVVSGDSQIVSNDNQTHILPPYTIRRILYLAKGRQTAKCKLVFGDHFADIYVKVSFANSKGFPNSR